MTIKDFRVGQKVCIYDNDPRRSAVRRQLELDDLVREVEVSKVGRKYITIGQGAWARQFEDAPTPSPYLIEHVDCGTSMYLFPTKEAAQEYLERKKLYAWFASEGQSLLRENADFATLKKIKELLEGCKPSSD